MPLSIKILKKVGSRSDMIASRSWPQSRISIGRGEECTLVLEDPKKHVSRVHVELEERDENSFRLTVVSKVNPVFINGKRHPPGSQLDLNAGDRFELGEYELELLAPPSAARAAAPVPDVEETTQPNSPLLQLPKTSPAPARPEKTEPVETIKPSVAPVPPTAPAPEPEELLFQSGNLPPVEPGLFDDPEPAPAAPALAPVVVAPATPAAPAAPAAAPPPAVDVFAEATFIGAIPSAPAGSLFEEATYVGGRPPAASAPAGPAGEAGMRAAVQAFLAGVGLEGKEISEAEAEAFLLQSGKVMRAAIEGAMALLAARATAKKELRAEDRTMVASKDNNPLKLMSDPQEALAFLLDTKDRTGGFLAPVQAVGDAFDDLRAHEVALFAGMRAALLGAIQRFDPKTLEVELEKSAGGLGLNRKAKLWEQFAAFQQKLARDAEDDFNKVFGREFMGTYMAQVKRLKSGGQ
jgi:type VI secretion system FHA domain protein